ncbi:MAG: ABC-F family ATP-binding cassette domain-containing protein [Candidatus Promineifilaceae bacterium]|nr:ABC-F family ATP-binding cassette domain-containing protein [Candidatus Promineifilaceae bacterium]
MLTAHALSLSFNIHPILNNVSFSVNAGERVGLIGPNGSGKTTLMRILAGELVPDRGHVAAPHALRIGYLPQGFELDPARTVVEAMGHAAGDPDVLDDELQALALALGEQPDAKHLQTAYDDLLARMRRFDAARVGAIVAALGLDEVPTGLPVARLSGGQKTRLALALVLLGEPDLLLLDEPTNHLDIPMLEWLEEWLGSFAGGALLISHDRVFLNRTVTSILALDPLTHSVRQYAGTYDDYVEQVVAEREKQATAYREQQAEIRRMRQDIARTKEKARRKEAATKDDQQRRYAKKVARKAAAREKKLERYLESDERVEKPARSWQMKLDFVEPAHVGQDVLALEDLAVGYPEQPPLLARLHLTVQGGQRVALLGPNGSGKTTLLRTIAGKLLPRAGRVRLGASTRLGYMGQEQQMLDPALSALEMVRRAAAAGGEPLTETEARSFLHFFLFADDEPLRPSGELSYGERARLSLALLVAQGCNFLLLDEPLNHLDIPSRSRFEEALAQFDGTVLAVAHDRAFIGRFATDVWQVTGGGIRHEVRAGL